MISEATFDDFFLVSQFLLSGYPTPCRLDRSFNGDSVLVFVREDIPSSKLHFCEGGFEAIFIEINLRKIKWLVCLSYNIHKNKTPNHLIFISKTLDLLMNKYEEILLIGAFNIEICDKPRDDSFNI